jgi:hypothetical protein
MDNTIALSKKEEWTHNGVINIDGQHYPMLITPLFVRSSFLLKVIVLSTNADYPIVCPFVIFT